MQLTKLDVQMFHDESRKLIYFGAQKVNGRGLMVTMSAVASTRRAEINLGGPMSTRPF